MGTINVRVSDEQEQELKGIIDRTGNTKSDQVRIAIKKYLNLSRRIEEGNFLAILPSGDIDYLRIIIGELESILQTHDGEVNGLLAELKDNLEFELLTKLKAKYPEQKTFQL